MKNLFVFLSVFFVMQSVFADMTCDTDVTDYYALYAPNSYACASGQFLPADAIACVACPNGFTCDGGTFNFNENYFQGLSFDSVLGTSANNLCAANFPYALVAQYEPNEHTCNAGYYLPANVDECTQCPTNSICSGGTYTFNETTDQGIQSCTSGTFAPTGSSVCYPHIMHVGNDVMYMKSTKQTTPSLNIKIGNDIFYINMTTNRTKTNKDSARYFHVDWGDNHYYVCDDTMCP